MPKKEWIGISEYSIGVKVLISAWLIVFLSCGIVAMVWMGDFAKGNLFLQWMPLGAGVIFAVILYFIMISIEGEKNK
jgi:hypothetical protein